MSLRLRTVALVLATGLGLSACTTYDRYGYGGVSVGYGSSGYGSSGYCDPYWDDCYSGYRAVFDPW